jgi:hypothetical protein
LKEIWGGPVNPGLPHPIDRETIAEMVYSDTSLEDLSHPSSQPDETR